MSRLTTNNEVSKMGMYELALNSCYIKDGWTRYRDFERDVDARDFARELMVAFGEWKKDGADTDNEIVDDDVFDDTMLDDLSYTPNTIKGLIALFYRNLWVMAELREKLKSYEDAEEQGLLLKLPCKVGDTVYVIGSLSEFGVTEEIELEVFECVVNKITLNYKYGNTMQMDCKEHSSFCWSMNIKKINELVFLTKEEAEQKLKDLERD